MNKKHIICDMGKHHLKFIQNHPYCFQTCCCLIAIHRTLATACWQSTAHCRIAGYSHAKTNLILFHFMYCQSFMDKQQHAARTGTLQLGPATLPKEKCTRTQIRTLIIRTIHPTSFRGKAMLSLNIDLKGKTWQKYLGSKHANMLIPFFLVMAAWGILAMLGLAAGWKLLQKHRQDCLPGTVEIPVTQ